MKSVRNGDMNQEWHIEKEIVQNIFYFCGNIRRTSRYCTFNDNLICLVSPRTTPASVFVGALKRKEIQITNMGSKSVNKHYRIRAASDS